MPIKHQFTFVLDGVWLKNDIWLGHFLEAALPTWFAPLSSVVLGWSRCCWYFLAFGLCSAQQSKHLSVWLSRSILRSDSANFSFSHSVQVANFHFDWWNYLSLQSFCDIQWLYARVHLLLQFSIRWLFVVHHSRVEQSSNLLLVVQFEL